MATQSESERARWAKLPTDVRLIKCEEHVAQLAESPSLPFPNDWTSAAREGIQDRRSRPDE